MARTFHLGGCENECIDCAALCECLNCKEKEAKKQVKQSLFTHLMDDFSELIYQHFPNFDNNIEEDTWKLLQLFTEETIYQLTEKESN